MLQFGTKFTQAVTGTAKRNKVQQRSTNISTHVTSFTHLSVILVQPLRLSSSIFLQFWANVLRETKTNFILNKA